MDSGDKVTGYAFDPADGAVSEVLSRAVGMNPYQAGSLANDRSRIGISAGNLGLARERWEWEKAHGGVGGGSGGMPYQFLQDPEGNFVRANKRTGELEPTDVGGLVKSSAYQRMAEKDKIQLQSLMKLRSDIIRDTAFLGGSPDSQVTLAGIEQEIQRLLPDEGINATTGAGGEEVKGGSKAISPQEYQALKAKGFSDEQLQRYGYEVR